MTPGQRRDLHVVDRNDGQSSGAAGPAGTASRRYATIRWMSGPAAAARAGPAASARAHSADAELDRSAECVRDVVTPAQPVGQRAPER